LIQRASRAFAIDPSKCGGFTAADAAPHLGAAASQVKASAEKASGDEWKCSYSAGGKTLAFTIAAAKSVKEAQTRLEKYTAAATSSSARCRRSPRCRRRS